MADGFMSSRALKYQNNKIYTMGRDKDFGRNKKSAGFDFDEGDEEK